MDSINRAVSITSKEVSSLVDQHLQLIEAQLKLTCAYLEREGIYVRPDNARALRERMDTINQLTEQVDDYFYGIILKE